MACNEVLESIRAHEKRIAEQKSKRGKKTTKRASGPVEISNVDEEEQEDEDEPMLDDD